MRGVRYAAALALICLNAIGPSAGFSSFPESGGDVHEEITREALKDTISGANLEVIVKAGKSQDKPGGQGAGEGRRHFDDDNFTSALQYMDREKKKALNYAADADTSAEDRTHSLRHFGLMLHTAQDFYAKSNYVELQLESPAKKGDPYSIELVDWSRVPDGYSGKSSGDLLTVKGADAGGSAIAAGEASPYNKDHAGTAAAKKASGGISHFQIARDLAVRETQRQWNLFEALIRGRYHGKADAIISALKTQPPGSGSEVDGIPGLDD